MNKQAEREAFFDYFKQEQQRDNHSLTFNQADQIGQESQEAIAWCEIPTFDKE